MEIVSRRIWDGNQICLISKCRSFPWSHWRSVVASHSVLCLGPSLPWSKLRFLMSRPLCWNLDSMRGNVLRAKCGWGFPGSSPHCLSHRTLSFLPSLELLGYWWLSPVLQPSVLFLFPMCPGDPLHIANFFIQCILQISSAYCNFPLHISFLKILLGGGIPWWSSG